MKLLNNGDKVGIVACSNGLDKSNKTKMLVLEKALNSIGLNVVLSDSIYRKKSEVNSTGKERAESLMKFFKDSSIKAIFDVSGGDLANGVLDYLDFEIIKNNNKLFFGYSDLTVVLNSLYSRSNIKTFLYQIRNIIESSDYKQIKEFKNTFMDNEKSLVKFNYEWIQGNNMEGIVVGGNLRCMLKLSGTKYMPDFKDKVIFLESLSGDVPKIVTYLTQCRQIGIFEEVKGIILGSFTEMEREKYIPSIEEIVKGIVDDPSIPIAKTSEIGHGKDSKCIIIGEKIII